MQQTLAESIRKTHLHQKKKKAKNFFFYQRSARRCSWLSLERALSSCDWRRRTRNWHRPSAQWCTCSRPCASHTASRNVNDSPILCVGSWGNKKPSKKKLIKHRRHFSFRDRSSSSYLFMIRVPQLVGHDPTKDELNTSICWYKIEPLCLTKCSFRLLFLAKACSGCRFL